MRKILFTTGTMAAGGAERVISSIANTMASDGEQITIVLWKHEEIFYRLDDNIEVINIESSGIIGKIIEFRKVIKKVSPDIVMSFLAPINIVTIISVIGLKINLVVSERNDPRHVPFNPLLRRVRNVLYHMANAITTQTYNNKIYFSNRLQSKCTVIFNPVNIKSEMQGVALATKKSHKIVAVSRLTKQKNLVMLIEAFEQILRFFPNCKLYIYGIGEDKKMLENLALHKNLQDAVFFPGAVTDIHHKIKDAELFVLSSNFEGIPNALLEAMSLGLPCISTNVSGAVDFIENRKNGILIPVGNKEALVKEMHYLLTNKSVQTTMGKEACKIFDRLNPEVIIKQWKEYIYEQAENS